MCIDVLFFYFFLMRPATTEIYTLSTRRSSDLKRAGPDLRQVRGQGRQGRDPLPDPEPSAGGRGVHVVRHQPYQDRVQDRKSTRLNSSHTVISYAVFCLKQKKTPTHVSSSQQER